MGCLIGCVSGCVGIEVVDSFVCHDTEPHMIEIQRHIDSQSTPEFVSNEFLLHPELHSLYAKMGCVVTNLKA